MTRFDIQYDHIKYKRSALLSHCVVIKILSHCVVIKIQMSNIYILYTVYQDVLHGQTLLTTDTHWWRISTE